MHQEEICPFCMEQMEEGSLRMSIELACTHRVCFSCCAEAELKEDFKVKCMICNDFQKVKNEIDDNRI